MNRPDARRLVRGLYAVTPDTGDTERLVAAVSSAISGGARTVQYRNKRAPDALALDQARALKDVCASLGAAFIVNDRIGLAIEIDADGVHLGSEDGSCVEARKKLGRAKLIGISCYDRIELAREAVRNGADYVAFGSFFPSRVKPGAVRAPLELLAQAKRELAVPVVAIGGITSGNAVELIRAGADAVAVISAVFDAVDVSDAARSFEALFDATHDA
jgi:thiamine-phosphate pyrophosphorylase